MDGNPSYTEFGIKIHKFQLTFKVQKHPNNLEDVIDNQSLGTQSSRRNAVSRHNSTASSVADSLRLLNLDTSARSRKPLCQESGTRTANWEFEGFYNAPARTSTPSSGYSSTAVSRASSFLSDRMATLPTGRTHRLHSADDSAYSEAYSTIEETSELADPFEKEQSSGKNSLASSRSSLTNSTLTRQPSLVPALPPRCSRTLVDIAPPLPPRISSCRPPARPPYPSTLVRAVQKITEPLEL